MDTPAKSSTGSVLVVENEPFMREAVEDILDSIGIEVFSAKNGHEGVATYLSHKEKIDLVILDMRLPGLTGAEILQMLRAINPLINLWGEIPPFLRGLPGDRRNGRYHPPHIFNRRPPITQPNQKFHIAISAFNR